MARNGSGTYNLPIGNPVVTGTTISSATQNTTLTDIATALTQSVAANGETPITANIPMSGFKMTGMGAASSRTDSATLSNVQDGSVNWIAAGGTADAITATYSPAITTLVDGQSCKFRASAANATTTPTFSPNGLIARTITRQGGGTLVAGNIYGANTEVELRYNLANTRWEIVNPNLIGTAPAFIGTNITNLTAGNVVNASKFSVRRSSTQSLTSGMFNTIQFNSKDFDTGNYYDAVTNFRFQPTLAGYYLINVSITILGATLTSCICQIFKNGSYASNLSIGPITSNSTTMNGSVLVSLNGSSDYIDVQALPNGTTLVAATTCVISGALLV